MRNLTARIRDKGGLQFAVSAVLAAAIVLYAVSSHGQSAAIRAALWTTAASLAVNAALLHWRVNRPAAWARDASRARADRWILICGCTAVLLTASLLHELAVSMILVLVFASSAFRMQGATPLRPTRLPVLITVVTYGVVLALAVVYLRTANGYIMPHEPLAPQASGMPSAYFAVDPSLSVYDKSHIRRTFEQLGLVSAGFVLLLSAFAGSRAYRPEWFRSPLAPAALLIALAATIPVPPFTMDGAHWAHWIGPSAAFLHGQWPYFDVFSYYGLLPVIALSGWIRAFGVSPLSLAVLLSILAFFSALIIYALIARRAHSQAAAFIGVSLLMLFAYDEAVQALTTPNHSALRFHFFVAAVLWLAFALFAALRRGGRRAYLCAFVLGVLSTWGASDGFFVLLGITVALGLLALRGAQPGWRKVTVVYGVYLAGVVILPVIASVTGGGPRRAVAAVSRIVDFLSIFTQGYGGLPLHFDAPLLLVYAIMAVLAAYCLRVVISGRMTTPKFAFCVFSLVLAIFYLIQSSSRGPVAPHGLLWVVLPAFLIVVTRPLQSLWARTPAAVMPSAIIVMTVVFAFGNPMPVLAERLHAMMAAREEGIQAWSQRCAAAKASGAPCEPVKPHTLAGLYANEAVFGFARDPHFSRMVAECRSGTFIVDTLDAFVRIAGRCGSPNPYPSFFSIATKRQAEEYSQILAQAGSVYFGDTFFTFQQRLADQLKATWLARRRAPSTCDPAKAASTHFVASGLSDAGTSRGVGLSSPTVLLDADRGILCHLRPGMHLRFAGSGDRALAAIDGDTVRVEGGPLDAAADGYPHPIEIAGGK